MPRPELHRGKIAKHPVVLAVRPLTRDDLGVLTQKRVGPPRVRQFRDTHHRLARLIAAGLRNHEVARITGYSIQRIDTLKQDPAFQQIIAEYRDKVDQGFINGMDEFYSTATDNMLRMERMVERHIDLAEENDELIPLKTLGPLIADRADRFGYGKHSKQTNEVVDFAAVMEQIAVRQGRSNVIDARATTPSQASIPAGVPPQSPVPREPQQGPTSPVAGDGFRRRSLGRG